MSWNILTLIACGCVISAGINWLQIFRAQREIRWHRDARMILFAYEKELLERGVTLPPRCAYCCQILPKHVDGCILDHDRDFHMERLIRPRIKYFRDGSQPPSLEGK